MDEKLLSLLGTPCWNADLHSCFNGALNLIDRAENLVVFLPASCYDGPHRIILQVPRQFSFLTLPLRRDDVFTVRERTLCNSEGTVIVDFGHPRVWTDRPPSGPLLLLDPPFLMENLLWLLSSLLPGSDEDDASFYSYVKCRIQNSPNLCSTRLSPLHRRLAVSCEEILQGIHIHDIEVIERALVHLVGLGKGLTPSGDDIISGFVSALHCVRPSIGRSDDPAGKILLWFSSVLHDTRDTTTAVSGHFLSWIAEGRLSDDMRKLVAALCSGERGQAGVYLEHFLSLGASSGREMMVGVALGMTLLVHWMQNSQ